MGTSLHYEARLRRLEVLAEEQGLDALLVTGESNVFYFTGYTGAGYLLWSKQGGFKLLVPVLEYLKAADELGEEGLAGVEVVVYKPYGLPDRLVAEESGLRIAEGSLEEVVAGLAGGASKCGYVGTSLQLYNRLGKACGGQQPLDLSSRVTEMRMVKEPWEVERIARAAEIADRAMQAALDALNDNVSEAEVAGVIEYSIREAGGEGPSFPPIVAFGLNTVYPHAVPSRSRVLNKPMPVLIDLGARYDGYCSDMTRTTFFNGSPAEFRHAAEAVYEAVNAALEKAAPGITAGELDAEARKILRQYGLSKYFIHSLGHGVGIDIHEAPRVTHGDKTELKPGMVITIEPGVYIPGRLGVRIEELVVITSKGAKKLSRFPAWLWQ